MSATRETETRAVAVAAMYKAVICRLDPNDFIFDTHSNRVWIRTPHSSVTEGDFHGILTRVGVRGAPFYKPIHTLVVKGRREINEETVLIGAGTLFLVSGRGTSMLVCWPRETAEG